MSQIECIRYGSCNTCFVYSICMYFGRLCKLVHLWERVSVIQFYQENASWVQLILGFGKLATCPVEADLTMTLYTIESNSQTLSYQFLLTWRHWQCLQTADNRR